MNEERTIAVVGGGISGLSVAEAIDRRSRAAGRPIRTVVLEEEPLTGGKIKTTREDGFVIESGPHGFLDREPKANELLSRLGLDRAVLRANEASANRFVVRKGKLRKLPSSPPAFLSSDVLPLAAKLRVLAEPLIKKSNGEEDESVWDFAARRIGPVAADQLVDAMVTGIFGGDPRALSLKSAFPRMRELEDQYGSLIKAQMKLGAPKTVLCSFEQGLGAWLDALTARADVRTRSGVKGILQSDNQFVVVGDGDKVRADGVVLAVPAYVASQLISVYAQEEAKKIGGTPYAPIAVVIHGFEKSAIGRELDGFGFLSPYIEQRKVLGSIWASTVFPAHAPEGTVMLRTMVGGWRMPELVELDDARIFEAVRDELSALMGIKKNVPAIYEKVIRWHKGIPQYTVGHSARVAAADRAEEKIPGLFFAGNAFRGVAMIACVADADKVAERAVAHVLGARA